MSQKLISKVKTMGVYGDVNTFFRLNIHLIRVRNKERKDSTTKAKVVNTKAWCMWFLRCKQPCTVRSIINKIWSHDAMEERGACRWHNATALFNARSFFWPLGCILKIDLSQRTALFKSLSLNLKHTSVATVFTFLEHFGCHKK